MEEFIHLITKTYGIAGLLLLSPAIAVVFLWRQSQTLQDKIMLAQDRVNDVHQKRVDDAKAISEKLMTVVQEHAELSKETNIALERINDTFTVLQMSGNLKKKISGGTG
jgi:hypothetical protein